MGSSDRLREQPSGRGRGRWSAGAPAGRGL